MYKIRLFFWEMVFFICMSGQVEGVCFITVQDINFGNINPLSTTDIPATSQISIRCTQASLNGYNIKLSTGSSGDYSQRLMQRMGGGSVMGYNLYTAANHTTVWGDGTSGTGFVGVVGHVTCNLGNPCTHTIYGLLDIPQPTVWAGSYLDTITTTLTFF